MKRRFCIMIAFLMLSVSSGLAKTDTRDYSTAEQAARLMQYRGVEAPDKEAQEQYCGTWYASELIYMDVLPADAPYCLAGEMLTILPNGSALLESDCELGRVEGYTTVPFLWGSYLGGLWMRPTDEFLTEYAQTEYIPNEDEPYLMQMRNEVDMFRMELEDGELTLTSAAQPFSTVYTREEPKKTVFPYREPLVTDNISDFDGLWYPYIVELYSYPINVRALPHVSALEISVFDGTVKCEALRLKQARFELYGVVNNCGTMLVYKDPEPIDYFSYFSIFEDVIEPEDGEWSMNIVDDRLTLDCGRYLILYCERAMDKCP